MGKIKLTFTVEKEYQYHGRCTLCTLTGILPIDMYELYPNIFQWANEHPEVKVKPISADQMQLIATGKSLQAETDSYDKVLGERIAESRAKRKLYKFCHTLCNMYINKQLVETVDRFQEARENFYRYYTTENLHYNDLINESH